MQILPVGLKYKLIRSFQVLYVHRSHLIYSTYVTFKVIINNWYIHIIGDNQLMDCYLKTHIFKDSQMIQQVVVVTIEVILQIRDFTHTFQCVWTIFLYAQVILYFISKTFKLFISFVYFVNCIFIRR